MTQFYTELITCVVISMVATLFVWLGASKKSSSVYNANNANKTSSTNLLLVFACMMLITYIVLFIFASPAGSGASQASAEDKELQEVLKNVIGRRPNF